MDNLTDKPKPCPCCGRCLTCGRGGFETLPYPFYPAYPTYPPPMPGYQWPIITYGNATSTVAKWKAQLENA